MTISKGGGAELIGAGPAGTTVLFMTGGYASRMRYPSTESDPQDWYRDKLRKLGKEVQRIRIDR